MSRQSLEMDEMTPGAHDPGTQDPGAQLHSPAAPPRTGLVLATPHSLFSILHLKNHKRLTK